MLLRLNQASRTERRVSRIENMGLYDRDYTRADFRSHYDSAPQMRMVFPSLTPVVKWLLIINTAVFVPSFMSNSLGGFFYAWFAVHPANPLQIWRLITYQFLHDFYGFGHIFWNMLILYFFGTMLERFWGSRKFLTFYLVCGAMGGVFYPLLALAGFLPAAYLVGASGAIFGMLAAGAILFPRLRVLVMFVFPVPLSVMAIILALISTMNLLAGDNAGGEAAHLAGMAAGVVYVVSESWRAKLKLKIRSGAWERKMTAHRKLELELDRILQKVHESGLHSLTQKEKNILKQATEAEQRRYKL
ncbi:MAG: rhomboid family intramembrane serine protease [Planctomycetota bacterium]